MAKKGKRINAGKYRHVVTFQKQNNTQDGYGEANGWVDAFTARASISPISGREIMADFELFAEISHRIFIRWIAGVDHTMRIVFGNRIFIIVAPPIDYDELKTELQILCKEYNPSPTE